MTTTGDQSRNLIKPTPNGARSARIHRLLLQVTGLLLDEGGLPAATVDAIAERSGVSKATIYNHWPSRTASMRNPSCLISCSANGSTGSANGST